MSLHLDTLYPDSETTSVCSSFSPLVDMSRHSDTLSWFRDNQCLLVLQSTGRHVAPFGNTILIPREPVFVLPPVHWKTCRSIRIHYPDSEKTSICSSSSPLVDMSPHSDTLSWFQDNQCLFFLQFTGRHVAPLGYTILIPRQPGFALPPVHW